MPQIIFNPGNRTIEIAEGTPLLEAAEQLGLSIEAPCGGRGVCGKCLVRITSGKADFQNDGMLPPELEAEGFVLICRTKAGREPLSVEVLSQLELEQGQFAEASSDLHLINRDLLPHEPDLEPDVNMTTVTLQQPAAGDGLSDLDRLEKAATSATGAQRIELPLGLLRTLPEKVRQDGGQVVLTHFNEYGTAHIIDIEAPGQQGSFGIAVDIGTTTVAVQLHDMKSGHILASKTDYNAQVACGMDVISRINYAKKQHRREELRHKVLESINGIVKELAASHGIKHAAIRNASLSGNTTMVHLLLGIDPEYIRLEPYTPAVYSVPYFKAGELGLDIHPGTRVRIAPSVGSYVGGDITSGLLCTSLATASEEICLFIDIGTNGELVLGNSEFLIGCACSAGPAFEGGGIEMGMRASTGAIECADVDRDTGKAHYVTIGAVPPVGICGSGMISLTANLFASGWLDAAGRLDRSRESTSIDTAGKTAKYIIAPAEHSGNGRPVYVSETDLDNLIRAKAAIFSACCVMLRNVGMGFEDLSKVYIAGGFGRYLDIDHAVTIGLLPDLPNGKFAYIGNASLMGAAMTLMSKRHRDKQDELAKRITYIDLSTEPGYMDQYTAALFLPHTDAQLFPHSGERVSRSCR
jgi:uncharacterized 2Fe-2S/4Fe-4S cluster protein (DUF4445 family)